MSRVALHGTLGRAPRLLLRRTGGPRPVVPTLAELLQRGGYATGCFTNNEWISEAFGLTRGFQRIEPLYENEKRPYPYAPATHELAAAWAEEQHAAGKQFFLFINDMEPHLPYTPLPADAAKFVRGSPSAAEMAAARDLKHPETTQYCAGLIEFSDEKLQLLTDLYDAEIATLDREIGRLLDRLRAKGILDSAIVVIAGDHGEMLGEHHHVSHNHSLWAQARRVPLLVRLPGTFDGGRTVRDLVRLEDVMPTVLEACRVAPPDGLDGRSLARDLPGRVSRAHHAQDGKALAKMQAEFPGADMHRLADSIDAVSDGRWHWLEFGDGRRELYDVAADAAEKHNLAAEKPAEAAAMAALLRGGH